VHVFCTGIRLTGLVYFMAAAFEFGYSDSFCKAFLHFKAVFGFQFIAVSVLFGAVQNLPPVPNKNIAGKWGRTLKLRQFASLYFGSGWTNNYLALVVNFSFISFFSSCSAGPSMNIPPAAIPDRYVPLWTHTLSGNKILTS